MITEAIVQQLQLVQIADHAQYCQLNYRCFVWPEFEMFNATIRECAMNGLRLPKTNQVILEYVKNNKPRRLILTNEQLEHCTYGVRHLIINN